MTLLRRQSRA